MGMWYLNCFGCVKGKISALNVTSFANVSAEIENYVNGDPLPKSINVRTLHLCCMQWNARIGNLCCE